ncbi:MAG: tetratricopeptide repeat protein [Ktedonobacteraceae bacterium]|nr:tetratricopeptide repeat protein [Ktedonobacteraceae bacterium]
MSPKKNITPTLSEEERSQVQSLLEQYHQLAGQLHNSANQQEAETALSPLTAISEPAQLALLKALARENHTDAADLLAAINAFAPSKEIRKEARRGLLRLETAHLHPQWTPPVEHAPIISLRQPNQPRFWKGWVSQTREEGEVELFLAWEQGYDYTEARQLIFLLDFWQDGVKDCIVTIESKRRADEHANEMRAKLNSVVDCTLAEGRRLLEEALSVNEWRGTRPHEDYRNNLPTINNLLLQNPDLGEDRGLTFIDPELMEQEVSVNFLGGWSMGDYGLTYDLLSPSSPLRADLTRDEWIEQHRAWAGEAHPARMELSFIREGEANQGLILLPGSAQSSTRKEVEVGWSLELLDTPLSGTLTEMPLGTSVNKETGRHWFWNRFTLTREQNTWRIQRISDEGARPQGLPVAELQQRIEEHGQAISNIMERTTPDRDSLQEIAWRFAHTLHYYDALIALLPLDYQVLQDAYSCAATTGNNERMYVYAERMLQRFPNDRVANLRNLGAALISIAYKYNDPSLQERQNHLLERAEETLRQATAEDQSGLSRALLAELLMNRQRYDEGKEELLKAREQVSSPRDETVIEAMLGNIALDEEHPDEAIQHYQRVTELSPDYPGIWLNLGLAQREQGQLAEAAASYKRAIAIDPQELRAFTELIALNMNQGYKEEAREIAQQGVNANPTSATLHALLATILFDLNNARDAQRELQMAEALDPNDQLVQAVRQQVSKIKKR